MILILANLVALLVVPKLANSVGGKSMGGGWSVPRAIGVMLVFNIELGSRQLMDLGVGGP